MIKITETAMNSSGKYIYNVRKEHRAVAGVIEFCNRSKQWKFASYSDCDYTSKDLEDIANAMKHIRDFNELGMFRKF